MKRFILIGAILLILVVGIAFVLKSCDVTHTVPDNTVAAYTVQQGTSYYLTSDYVKGKDTFGNYVAMRSFWDSPDGGNSWYFEDRGMTLNERGGKITVSRR